MIALEMQKILYKEYLELMIRAEKAKCQQQRLKYLRQLFPDTTCPTCGHKMEPAPEYDPDQVSMFNQ